MLEFQYTCTEISVNLHQKFQYTSEISKYMVCAEGILKLLKVYWNSHDMMYTEITKGILKLSWHEVNWNYERYIEIIMEWGILKLRKVYWNYNHVRYIEIM